MSAPFTRVMRIVATIVFAVAVVGIVVFFTNEAELDPEFEPVGAELGSGDLPRKIRHVPTDTVLVLISPGKFVMGTPVSEAERDGDELQHEAAIQSPFYMAETEVTVGLWNRIMGELPDESVTDEDLPRTGVSWHKAKEFLARMNATGQGGWRLPTEAEWEYACRAGTKTAFSFGDNITTDQANYYGRYPYAGGKRGLERDGPVPVRSLPPNPWGLYEMHGNVWEWCEDVYVFDPRDTTQPSVPGASRVMRGGSWQSQGNNLRSGYRDGYPPNSSGPKYGFRIVWAAPDPDKGGRTSVSR